jgi:hypothetical protein
MADVQEKGSLDFILITKLSVFDLILDENRACRCTL